MRLSFIQIKLVKSIKKDKMECKWISVCPLRILETQGKLNLRWRKEYCENDFSKCKRYRAEEMGIAHHDNMLPNGEVLK